MKQFSLSDGLAPTSPRPVVAAPLRALAWVLRRLTVLVAVVAVQQRRWLRRVHRVDWALSGTCKSCGTCCENLLLPLGRHPKRWAALRRFWHETVFDFFPRGFQIEQDGEIFAAYGCRNFTAERTCSRYALRPFICRAYPALALLDVPAPKPHCGYQLVQLRRR